MPQSAPAAIAILEAAPHQMDVVRTLFREYADWLQADICLRGFERELAELPGAYAPPRGRLLLAQDGADTLGVVALRPLQDGACEVKRLYVRPQARRRGIGRQLMSALLQAARDAGYRRVALETLERMGAARRLYAALGFTEVPADERRPSDHPIAMELVL